MTDRFKLTLEELSRNGNLRKIPDTAGQPTNIDLTSNDYMGIAANRSYFNDFMSGYPIDQIEMSSSAARLLSSRQKEYTELESLMASLYDKECLLFNSGYHANTGIIPALCNSRTLIIADKLVHASIIDGIILSRCQFIRFKHNDLNHLEALLRQYAGKYDQVLVICESIYSMDGDICPLDQIAALKISFPNVMLYVDEAHGFGVRGEHGLGICEETATIADIDIIVGTFGKAAASYGAFAIVPNDIKQYLVNKSRSFIFSTALPPFSCMWSKFVVEKLTTMSHERKHLHRISSLLANELQRYGMQGCGQSQIVPLITGSSESAIKLSKGLRKAGFNVLPIRTPTVPKGTERVRFSLHANLAEVEIMNLANAIQNIHL